MFMLNRADIMSAPALLKAINRELPGTVTTEGSGDSFVFYDPDGMTVPARRFPFITVVTGTGTTPPPGSTATRSASASTWALTARPTRHCSARRPARQPDRR